MIMKLKSIDIDHYKNLDNNFSFEVSEKYIALIGLNGSGKSNLLEALSFLFAHIMEIDIEKFPFSKYIVKYSIREHEVEVSENSSLKNGTLKEEYLPSSVIACYSGEDDRLWNSGFKGYYVKFFNQAIKGGDYKPLFLYINKYCWKIAFISLLYSENEDVKHFILNKLHIDINYIEVTFKSNVNAKSRKNDASNWYKRVESKFNGKGIPIEDLKNDEKIDLGCKKYPNLTNDQIVFYYLYFLCMPDKKRTYGLKADKLIDSIRIKFKDYDFDDLSEGEKKLILIECITKVLGDENSLVLLDEPDAHTHIAMKKDLLKLISEFEGETVFTTHSPMFLNKRWSGYCEKNIYYMQDGKIENAAPLKHLAELTDNEFDYFEGAFILSSKRILVTEGPYDIDYLKHAIDKLSEDNTNYRKLTEQVAFLHSGGADNAAALYEQSLYPSNVHYDFLVFLFDYDKQGYEGYEKVKHVIETNNDTKAISIFYQSDYAVPKTTKPNDKDPNSYMAEDLFHIDSYRRVTDKIQVRTHKELRNMTWNDVSHKRTNYATEAIKYYIQENYSSFEKEWLQNFKPVLDKLLEVFKL